MKTNLIRGVISLFLTLGIVYLNADMFYMKYDLHLLKSYKNSTIRNVSFYDIDSDGQIESVFFSRNIGETHSIDIYRNKTLLDSFNTKDGEFIVSQQINFDETDTSKIKDMYYISAYEGIAYLNILTFNEKGARLYNLEQIAIDSISTYNILPDVLNFKVRSLNNFIAFDLVAGFSIQPRNIYLYDKITKRLIKTEKNSIGFENFDFIEYNNKNYILIKNIFARGNTVSKELLEQYKKSNNPDTIELYHQDKNNVYEYGDFASYTMVYDMDLKFAFEPIEHFGWTKVTTANYLPLTNNGLVISITFCKTDSLFPQTVHVVNFKGDVLLSKKFTDINLMYKIFCNPFNKTFSFFNKEDRELLIYNDKSKLIRKKKIIPNLSIIDCIDLNNDKKAEWLMFDNNHFYIYNNKFKLTAKCEVNDFNIYANNVKYLNIKDRNIYEIRNPNRVFVTEYKQNKLYYLNYLFYICIFIAVFIFIVVIQKINSRRLEADNKRLEKKVTERTYEIIKQKKTIEQNLKEKEVLLKEVHHRVKNNLQVISSLIDLQTQKISDDTILSVFFETQNRIKAIALIHRKLYQSKNIAEININDYINQLTEQLAQICVCKENLNIKIDAPHVNFDIDTIVPLGLILNELITNAFKYAFHETDNAVLEIKMHETEDGTYQLIIADNGKGISSDINPFQTNSLGLRLVKRLCRQLYGDVKYNFNNGAEFTLSFKDTQTRKNMEY